METLLCKLSSMNGCSLPGPNALPKTVHLQLSPPPMQIWASFSDHISSHGLTRDGLRSLYTSGLADIEHDYRLVCDRAADALEAKRALEEVCCSCTWLCRPGVAGR